MLDIDEPSEVVAAAGKFSGAIAAADQRVAAIVAQLVVPARPRSPLDAELVRRLDWIKDVLGNALADSANRADATYLRVRRLMDDLVAADADNGALICRSGST
ncbi:hypothetical protein F3087_40270 [Nocardia colli]|uniref:Uncharacterized protein n=1 Tax=Nocardia colli TaxID=2545717 RepID=A0A5N0E1B6_9NOCA|nr:hypothetical protein [Nocardia colli]KAA8881904.1 hypothetical protein F3087_40270 [Nocardia colli]